MSTIPSYPVPAALDGSELIAAWKNGRQVALPPALLNPSGAGLPGLSAYQLWLQAGNAGNVADFLTSLKGANGDQGLPFVMPAGTVARSMFLSRVEALSPGNVDKLYLSLPLSRGGAVSITLNHSWSVSSSDTALSAFVISTLGISSITYATLFA